MHLPSYLLSFPVPAPCPGSHGRGSWCSSWSSAAVMRVREIQYETPKVWLKTLPFFLFPWYSYLTSPLLHRVLSKGFMKLQESLSMIHKWAELGHVWPIQILGNKSMGAVFVKADPSPLIPHGKQGQQQKLYRIKVLGKALSALVLQPLCVSCPLLFLQLEVHKSLMRLAGVSQLSWKEEPLSCLWPWIIIFSARLSYWQNPCLLPVHLLHFTLMKTWDLSYVLWFVSPG